jgi:uncharacterized protein (DUF433 family)
MKLPEFLTEVDFGEIRLTGSRIGLYDVIYYLNNGYSPDQLQEEYSHLPPGRIQQVFDFYQENRDDVDAYVAREEAAIERLRAETPRRVNWEELRRRMNERSAGGS